MVVRPVRTGILPRDEGRATGGAARVGILVREKDAVLGNAVDVRCPAHHAVRVSANVPHADVVAKNDEDVGFPVRRRLCWGNCEDCPSRPGQHNQALFN